MLYTPSKIHFIFQIPENLIKNTSQSWWWLFFAVQHLLIFLASIKSKKSLYKTIYLCVYVSHQYDFFIKKCVLLVTLLTGFCLQAKQSFTRSEVVVFVVEHAQVLLEQYNAQQTSVVWCRFNGTQRGKIFIVCTYIYIFLYTYIFFIKNINDIICKLNEQMYYLALQN